VLETIERRIERALLDLQPVPRDLADAQQDAVPVQRSQRERLQNEEIESALQ
jgi:hypothetical protein